MGLHEAQQPLQVGTPISSVSLGVQQIEGRLSPKAKCSSERQIGMEGGRERGRRKDREESGLLSVALSQEDSEYLEVSPNLQVPCCAVQVSRCSAGSGNPETPTDLVSPPCVLHPDLHSSPRP